MKTKIINIAVLLVLIAGTLFFLLKDQEMDQLLLCIKSARKSWLFLGLLCMLGFICLESVIIHYLINALSYSIKLLHCIKYSFIGFFVSAITPSSTGGQPAQIYFMKNDGISISVSSLVLMVVTVAYKSVLLVMAFVMLIIENAFVMKHVAGIEFIMIFGILINVIVIVALALIIFKQSLAKRLTGKLLLLLGKRKIIKKPDEKLKKLLVSISKYDKGAAFLKEHKWMCFKVFVITVIQRLLYLVVTYTIYRAFGLKGCSPFEIITLQLIISLAVDNLPWPGGMGVNEGIFMIFFTEIFTSTYVTAGLMLTRGLNYYFIILAGGLVTAFAKFMRRKQINTLEKEDGSL